MQAQWCKQMIEDQKSTLRKQIRRSNTKKLNKVGLAFLGKNFQHAFDYYQNMAERYFQMSKQDKRILGATKKAFIFAAENAIEISKLYKDETNQTRITMRTKAGQNLQFAESIQQKINSDPTCNAREVFMKQYAAAEQILIEKGSDIKGRHFPVWAPESGMIK